tara:strand:+ start:84 stop:1733 length:1650 start_codon:yes stop_codon:yes gene_type:complete
MNDKKIVNVKDVKGIKDFYVAKISVWIDLENKYKHYFYRDKLSTKRQKADPELAVLSYEGSSTEGKGIPKQNLLRDMEETSKEILIEILEFGDKLDKDNTGFLEQKHIVTHMLDFPDDDDIYNEHASGLGTKERNVMISHIKSERLWEKLQKHLTGDLQFLESWTDRERIQYLIENDLFVQSRVKKEGNKDSILDFADQMKRNPQKAWKGKLLRYMPEEGTDNDEEIGNGNQSARAALLVKKRKGLQTIDVPFEDHDGIMLSDKEAIGNQLNPRPEDKSDEFSDDDFIRSLKNVILDYTLVDKNGEVNFNHPRIDKLVKNVKLSPRAAKPFFTTVNTFFKNEQMGKWKQQEGCYDFSDRALKITTDDEGNKIPNNNLKQYKMILRDIIYEYSEREKDPIIFTDENILKLPVGMWGPAKIATKIYEYGKLKKDLPKYLLVLVSFDLEEQSTDFDNDAEKKRKIKIIEDQYKDIQVIVRKLPMTKISVTADAKATGEDFIKDVFEYCEEVGSEVARSTLDKFPTGTNFHKVVSRVLTHMETPITKDLTKTL